MCWAQIWILLILRFSVSHATRYPIDTVIKKKIEQILQQGTGTRYNKNRKYYWLHYKNGDSEEMMGQFVTQYKCVEPDTILHNSDQIQQ